MAAVDNLTVLPRPRSAWQAMDAGFTLARPHFPKLVLVWAIFAWPFFLIPQLLLPNNPMIAICIGWWFKPLYEVPILIYLSSALFGEQLPVRVVFRRSLKHVKRLLFTFLTLARLSPHRALVAPVVILEQLPRKQRRARIGVLTAAVNRAFSLQMVCLHVEYILTYGLMLVALFLIPVNDSFSFLDFFENFFDNDILPRWYWLLSAAAVFTAAALVAPFYVGAGFMLYINRRMKIEAWDIEHQFRRIARERVATTTNRLKTHSARATVFCALLLGVLHSGTSDAQTAAPVETPIPVTTLTLESDHLPSVTEARELIKSIKAHRDFGYKQEKRVLKFKKKPAELSEDESDFDVPDWLSNFQWIADAMQGFANLIQWLLWVMAAILVVVIVLAIHKFLPENVRATLLPRTRMEKETSFVAHPLTTNLPDNIPDAARKALKSGNKREALSLLYRGAIRALINEHQLPVPKGATEAECLNLVKTSADDTQKTAFQSLVIHWQQTAYAKVDHADHTVVSLIKGWPRAFNPGTAARSENPTL